MTAAAAVLDATVLLALCRGEEGEAKARREVSGFFAMSAVNWSEVLAKISDYGIAVDSVEVLFDLLGILKHMVLVPFETPHAMEAARIRSKARAISLGDRACLGLGRMLGLRVVTCDRAWADLDLGVKVELLR